MKKLLLGTAMSMVMVAGATAADLDVKAPVPAWGWTGCYVGANVGGGFSWLSDTDTVAGPPPQVYSNLPGVVGGGQVGCDVQAGRWVIGVAGAFDAANIAGTAIIPATGQSFESKIPWTATATARLGFLFAPSTLVYARGGGAWSRDKLEMDIALPTPTATDNRAGWTVGVGVEHRFWPNVSVFLEYNYLDFGNKTVPFSPVGSNSQLIAENIHEVLVGLNFRFGIDSPIAARY